MQITLATSVYAKLPFFLNFGEVHVLLEVSNLRYAQHFRLSFSNSMCTLMKLAPGWVLIQVNFHPEQEIGPKVGGGCSFESGCSFVRLWYICMWWCRPSFKKPIDIIIWCCMYICIHLVLHFEDLHSIFKSCKNLQTVKVPLMGCNVHHWLSLLQIQQQPAGTPLTRRLRYAD